MRRGFTLMEILLVVILISMIGLMIGGSLSMAAKSWETAQRRISTNYNRRTVLDMVKRQMSSIYYRSEAEEWAREAFDSNRNEVDETPMAVRLAQAARERREQTAADRAREASQQPRTAMERLQAAREKEERGGKDAEEAMFTGFELPDGTSYFSGTRQKLQFLSTVSFLSDFPGQVAVNYYVVQGEEDEDGNVTFSEPSLDEDAEEELPEGSLYLVLEEKNLFLSKTLGDELSQETPELEWGENPDPDDAEDEEPTAPPIDVNDVSAQNQMVLLGPLRAFEFRYRKPMQRKAQDADEEDEDWSETWNVDGSGRYPSAVELTIFYEEKGSEFLAKEELPGIRLVIPIFDTQNLQRIRTSAPF